MADVVIREVTTYEAILVGGETVHNVHAPDKCAGETCCIHNPSDHHMRDWPMHFRDDRYLMERICSHGIGHPDPDDPTNDTVHGCDGCCFGPGRSFGTTVSAE